MKLRGTSSEWCALSFWSVWNSKITSAQDAVTSEGQGDVTCDSLGDVTWSRYILDVRDLSGRSEGSRRRKPHQKGQTPRLCPVMSARGFLLLWFSNKWGAICGLLSGQLYLDVSAWVVWGRGARWWWPAEGHQCQRQQPCYDIHSIYVYVCVYMCVCVCVRGYVFIYVYACVYVYVYVCVYTHVYVYVYAYFCIDCGSQ